MLLISIFICSCATRHGMIGTWETPYFTYCMRVTCILNGIDYIVTNELILNADSSWQLNGTCQNYEGKKWFIKNDSLLLCVDSTWLSNVSVQQNKIPQIFQGYTIGYRIYRNSLSNSYKFFHSKNKNGRTTRKSAKYLDELRYKG